LINQSAAKSFRWCPAVGQPFWKIHRFSSLLHKQTEEAASRERRGEERREETSQMVCVGYGPPVDGCI
jgi:hypothetical protein